MSEARPGAVRKGAIPGRQGEAAPGCRASRACRRCPSVLPPGLPVRQSRAPIYCPVAPSPRTVRATCGNTRGAGRRTGRVRGGARRSGRGVGARGAATRSARLRRPPAASARCLLSGRRPPLSSADNDTCALLPIGACPRPVRTPSLRTKRSKASESRPRADFGSARPSRSPYEHPPAGAPRRHCHPRSEVAGAPVAAYRLRRGGRGVGHAGLRGARRRWHRRGRRRQPVHRLRLRHRRDHGGRLGRGRGPPGLGAARRLHPHLFHGDPVRGVRGGGRAARRADARGPRQEVGAVQLRRRGGGERGEDRPRLHQAHRGRRLRPRLPRPHQPHDGADLEEHAVQAGLRAVRPGGVPGAGRLRLPLADRCRERLRRGFRAGHRPDQQADRRGERRGDHHRAGARRGRVHRAA